MSIFIFLKNAFEFFLYLIWSTLSLAYGTYITTQAFLNCLFLYRSVFKWFLILDTFMLRPASSVLQYFAIVVKKQAVRESRCIKCIYFCIRCIYIVHTYFCFPSFSAFSRLLNIFSFQRSNKNSII